ncbi:beta-alanine-activating enzyme beta-propeller domain-containing protein [Carboxylicivirga taeanensis]|uniref:beta-alanine-activating enzyme beta-propeller domain-containing protein n=1 Tax=Carboxylicivirga taeanensis TaxID=1416875 RepID=UPI003F6DB79E
MMKLLTVLMLGLISFCAKAQTNTSWQFDAEAGIYSSPVILLETLYFGDNANYLYALNKQTGQLNWKIKLAGSIKSKLCVYNNWLIVYDGSGTVSAIHSQTGRRIWTFSTEGESCVDQWDYYNSSPVVVNHMVYVGSGDNHVYAIDAVSGQLKWKYKTGGVVHASPVVHDNKVLIGSFDGYFYALDAVSGSLVWRFKTVGDRYFPNGAIQKAACIYRDKVIFGSRDFNIYALDIETGRGHWNYKERGSWIIATPLVVNDRLYFGTSDTHRFYCFQANSGEILWEKALNMRVYSTALAKNERIYFGCFNGKVYGLSAESGQKVFEFQTKASLQNYASLFKSETQFADGVELYGDDGEEIEKQLLNLGAFLSTPLIDNGMLYIGDANGHFYGIELKDY